MKSSAYTIWGWFIIFFALIGGLFVSLTNYDYSGEIMWSVYLSILIPGLALGLIVIGIGDIVQAVRREYKLSETEVAVDSLKEMTPEDDSSLTK